MAEGLLNEDGSQRDPDPADFMDDGEPVDLDEIEADWAGVMSPEPPI